MMGWLGWKSLVNVSGLRFISVGLDFLWIDWCSGMYCIACITPSDGPKPWVDWGYES